MGGHNSVCEEGVEVRGRWGLVDPAGGGKRLVASVLQVLGVGCRGYRRKPGLYCCTWLCCVDTWRI